MLKKVQSINEMNDVQMMTHPTRGSGYVWGPTPRHAQMIVDLGFAIDAI